MSSLKSHRVGDIEDRVFAARTYWTMSGALETPTYRFFAGRIELASVYKSKFCEFWIVAVKGHLPVIINTQETDFERARDIAVEHANQAFARYEDVPAHLDADVSGVWEMLEQREGQAHGGELKRTRRQMRRVDQDDEDWMK